LATARRADAACVEGAGDLVIILFQSTLFPTGMGGRGTSPVRGGASTPTTGRGWMPTGATGLDWTTAGD
jgi:hypothetical protein